MERGEKKEIWMIGERQRTKLTKPKYNTVGGGSLKLLLTSFLYSFCKKKNICLFRIGGLNQIITK